MRLPIIVVLLTGLNAGCTTNSAPTKVPPNPSLSPNAPQDQPVDARGEAEADDYRIAIAPYVEKGRQSYPDAKKRYLAGLPAGNNFFAITNLRDKFGTTEQVFVAVTTIRNDQITGRIATDIIGVKGFKNGDSCTFSESELVDWLITHPDGSEEGNVVGNFVDEWQKTRPRRRVRRSASLSHCVHGPGVNVAPNQALQRTAAAVLVFQGQKSRLAAAAAELGR